MKTMPKESVLLAAKDLIGRPESRKVMMVFTDGMPNEPELAVQACRYCERAGIEVVLIGIFYDYVRLLHHRTTVVSDLNDLGKTTMQQLTAALKRPRR